MAEIGAVECTVEPSAGVMGRMGAGVRGVGGAIGSVASLAGSAGAGLGGPLAGILMSAPRVVTAVGAVGSALAALLSPVGLIAAAVGGAVFAWTQFSTTGQKVTSEVVRIFGDLWATERKVFGRIADAIAAGDIQLAARILWAGLRVLFAQGAEHLTRVWPAVSASARPL